MDVDDQEARRRGEFMQALTTEHFALQSGRSATISESAGRSSLYMTTVSSAVVALALAGQVANLGTVFALAILPVVFFLGLVTYGRLLQSGVEDTIYARAIGRIRRLYGEINPSRADYFRDVYSDRAGLRAMGLFRRWWQQFLTAAAMVAMVNSVVAGAFVAIAVARWVKPPALIAVAIGGGAALVVGASFYRHQRRAWNRVDQAIPDEVTSQ
ncbi:MAG: hypothetical protein E6J01_12305 [Chloroflexi bacterium]|nr:MAG: hypothetical protein E6J01_12305 [Chloroflexota bacterium]